MAAVIGRTGRDIHPADADTYIAGYTILIDWSARDLQFAEMQVRLGPTKGKDTATTLGPVLVTPDELQPWRTDTAYDLAMTVEINGQQLGQDRWSSMAFSLRRHGRLRLPWHRGSPWRRPRLRHLRRRLPGRALGSPRFDAHPPLQPGDLVTVTVEQLGSLTSHITTGTEGVPVPPARRRG